MELGKWGEGRHGPCPRNRSHKRDRARCILHMLKNPICWNTHGCGRSCAVGHAKMRFSRLQRNAWECSWYSACRATSVLSRHAARGAFSEKSANRNVSLYYSKADLVLTAKHRDSEARFRPAGTTLRQVLVGKREANMGTYLRSSGV